MSAPAVSVVVPCYNGGRFLPQLLASLDAQTFRDFETIVVDDGSTDAATRTALDALPPAVRLVRQENRGLPAARNAGFSAARGAFVLPLDCDDALEPDFLAEAVARLSAAPREVAFVFADMRVHGAIDAVLPRHFNLFDQLFLNQLPYCLLLRASAWRAAGGYDEAMRDGYEDWEFNIRLARSGASGLGLSRPLFRYYASDQGMLMGLSAWRHGRLWRRIREKNADLYHLPTLIDLHRKWSPPPRRIPLVAALALLLAGRVLPDAAFGALFRTALRWRRLLQSAPR